jgi:hypothetical protein
MKDMIYQDQGFLYQLPSQTLPAAQPAPVPCCGKYETCIQACTPRGKFLGAREAAAQPAVPDAITDNSESPEYIQGWNDCRAETLKMRKP